MIDGLYGVHFRSAASEGTGTVAISNGSVNGGDFGYCYQGALQDNDGKLQTVLSVEKFNPQAESIFGPMSSFQLDVSGESSEKGFNLNGHIVEQPQAQISIRGEFIKPLV